MRERKLVKITAGVTATAYVYVSDNGDVELDELNDVLDIKEFEILSDRSGLLVIGIDCEPCRPRPDTYLKGALEVFGLATESNIKQEPVSKLFGAWTWEFKCLESVYEENKKALENYFEELLEKKYIRGSMYNFVKGA